MDKSEIKKKIETSGELTDTLIQDAIRSTEEIDFKKLKEEFDEAERQYSDG